MTDFAKLTDKELEAAINHHRRQRNISAGGVNQIANMHHTKMVKAGEAEMAKRISAKMESVELDEAEVNYVIKHKKTRQVLNTHSDYATAKDEHEGLGADKHEYGVYKQTKKDAALRNRNTYREEAELDEANGIKGWKNAASDIAKMRAAKGKNVKLVSLKKDGSESKMNDATKMFGSEAEAQEHHDRVTKLNPKMKIRHNLYVDGKHIKTLGEEVELEEASTKIEIPKSRYETILKMHGPKRVVRTPKGDMQYKGAEHFSSNKSTDTMITQTYSHPDHNIATIEKHTHNPTGKTTYYMYKKDVKEDAEQIDEISKDTLHSYWQKAATMRYPLDVKARKAATQKTNRIRSGKSLAGYKPKDELTPDEKRTLHNRNLGMTRAGNKLFRSEETVLGEAETKYVVKGKSPFYKQDHYINTHETPKATLIKKNIKHATRMDLETAKKIAKDLESHPNKYKTEVVPVNESAEQIDELSKKTLSSYIKKASADQYFKGQDAMYHDTKAKNIDRNSFLAADSKKKHYGLAARATEKASNRDIGIGRAVDRLAKEEVELELIQIDEISKDLKQRYVEKGAEDVYNRFTGRGKYEKPKDPSKYTKTGRVKKSALNSPESVKYREKLMNRRSIVNKVSNELTGKNRFEEFVLDEAIIQGSKEHLEKLKGMLDNAKPGSVDHSQIKHAIASMFGPSHIPEKHRGKS